MPGRDDLVQQNIARAQANSQAPRPQESDGKSSSSGGLGAPRSFLGGNFEVYSALDRVEFQGALGDASLRGNIAYIRVWKRGGTAQQTSAEVPAQDIGAYYTDTIGRELDERLGQEREKLEENQFVEYTPGESSYAIITGDVTRDDDGNIIGDGTVETTFVPPPNSQRKQDLSSQIPQSSQGPAANVSNPPASSAPPKPPASAVGAVKSANPNGLINTISRVGSSVLGIAAGKPPYSGKANGNGAASTPTGEMMWQFLFNPSELELEVGPEFKNAETWGVSDKGNSGQPLHWSHNKNALLKFNSVLLNGFVFGRKVEALEQGLFELFMARDGEGQHGPHVLEFVWGKRVFGPCVIKNINIKEKMWDEGEVVNAEVSFTLEQVPEWTINDGFVDVARPGRLGTIGDPTTPGSSAENPGGAKDGEKQPPPGGGAGSPGQKPAETLQTVANQCKAIISDQKYIQTFITDVSSKLEGIEGLVYGPFGILRTENTSVFTKNASNYKKVFAKYSGNSLYKSSMTEGTLGANCVDISPIVYSWKNSGNAPVRQKDKVANQQLLICYKNIKSVVDKKAKEGKCSNLATPTGGKSGPGLF